MRIDAELSEDGRRIEVRFPYSAEAVRAIRGDGHDPGVPGRRFVPRDKGGPMWTVPADIDTGRRLREAFGQSLVLGPRLRAWGRAQVQRRRNLGTLALAQDAELERLPHDAPLLLRALEGEALPELGLSRRHALSRARPRRGYQFADIAMMAQANVLNANQPGTGKTIEVIGALIEGGILRAGPHLVVAPVRALENTWAAEIGRWTELHIFTSENPRLRSEEVKRAEEWAFNNRVVSRGSGACFVVVNADMVRARKLGEDEPEPPRADIIFRDGRGNAYVAPETLRLLLSFERFASITIDEFHKLGLNNRGTLLHIGLSKLRAMSDRAFALSGTPMGGKPRKLWPVLNWLEPEVYSSFWRWADTWLEVNDNGFGKVVGGIAAGREEEFYESHSHNLVRRLKRDALPGLPEQVEIIVLCDMSPRQRKVYKQFEEDAEALLGYRRVAASNVLSMYTRLKQFANATCKVIGDKEVVPTSDSPKLAELLAKLDGEGIRRHDPEPGARALVSSESKRFVAVVAAFLRDAGIDCDELTGDTKDSKPIIERFERGDERPYVIVMTIQTGGVSLNLEAAGSTHELDETWNPDDSEQFRDRADRGGRTEPLRCYMYRTRGTIQETIAEVAEAKRITNANILDIARKARALRVELAAMRETTPAWGRDRLEAKIRARHEAGSS